MRLLIIGHSHTTSLAQAAVSANITHHVVRLKPETNLVDLRTDIAAAISILEGEAISSNQISDHVSNSDIIPVASVGGNFHNVVGMFRHPIPYDFLVPELPDISIEKDHQVIQYDAMKDYFYFHLRRLFLTILDIKRVVGPNIIHIDSPPPPEDNVYIKGNIDEYFKDKFSGIIPDINLPNIRLKHWILANTLYKNFCNEAKIDFISNSSPLYNRYFLMKKYFGNDATHANAEFSASYLRTLTLKARK